MVIFANGSIRRLAPTSMSITGIKFDHLLFILEEAEPLRDGNSNSARIPHKGQGELFLERYTIYKLHTERHKVTYTPIDLYIYIYIYIMSVIAEKSFTL